MRRILLILWFAAFNVQAITVFPIDRASMLAGSRFDLKVEFERVVDESQVSITINGLSYRKLLNGTPQWMEKEDGAEDSSLLLRDVSLNKPGTYRLVASDGVTTKEVTWDVYATGPRKAKNVILFIGDGMTIANRTAARILSKGITEGKYHGVLSFDDMPCMALIGTSGVESVITDSANSMHAYTTGHKSSNSALGVYASRARDNLDHPKVETITELVKRKTRMAVGILTDAEVEDATPAAMVAHTRSRGDKEYIADQLFRSGADVVMGGGSAYFLPKGVPGSRRKDSTNLVEKFQQAGYALARTDSEMKRAAAERSTTRLLGLYHLGNLDGALDRRVLKKGTVDQFPEQPDLADMTRTALQVLSRNKNGFVLMVESALIDKSNHALDWERSVYNTIMLSNAVQVAKDFAAKNKDTLIIVTPDHNHGLSLVGTVDDDKPGADMRDKVGVYEDAGYPNYPPADADGYPATVDVSKRLVMSYGNTPDYYETYRPKLEGPFVPTIRDKNRTLLPNPKYQNEPGAVLHNGNLPRTADQGVHVADDLVLTAIGPGAERFHGFIENTDVFRNMVEALGMSSRR